jgi:hypothetical protein
MLEDARLSGPLRHRAWRLIGARRETGGFDGGLAQVPQNHARLCRQFFFAGHRHQ